MYTTSNEYKNDNLQAYRQFESRITIGNRIITNEEVVSINLQQSIQQEATFTIGNTISSSLNLTYLHNDIEVSDREIINLEIGLLVNSDYEYIPLGVYNIDLCNSNDTTTIITAYDNMVKFDISYKENNSQPTVHSVINRLSELTGIEFAGTLSNYNNYNLVSLSGYSCREVLGFVAGVLGCNAIIDREGKFKFINISKTSSLTITNENYSNYFRQSKLYKISKIVNTLDESTIEIGSTNDDTVCLNMTNPFVNEEILQDIYNKMNGFSFLPYELNWNGDLSLDLGDSIEIVDKKGTSLMQPILNQSFVYTGGLSSIVQAQGDTKLANDYTTKSKEEANLDRVKDETIENSENIDRLNISVAEIDKVLANKIEVKDLATINADIKNLKTDKAEIKDLNVTNATIDSLNTKVANVEELVTTKANIVDLNATNAEITKLQTEDATIKNLVAEKATITDLNAAIADIEVLDAKVGDIKTLVNGNLTSDNIQSLHLTASNTTFDNAIIKDAMIEGVNAGKVNAGTLNTNNVNISSKDGSMLLQGSLQQFKDENDKVRIQIGKDTTGNFTFILYDENGTGVLIDETGIKDSSALGDGLIVDANVSDNANISGDKLDIDSVFSEMNESTSTLKSTKIYLDDKGQTLDVAFNAMETTVEGNTEQINTNTTSISTQQGEIDQLISNTTITKEDGTVVQMKDAFNSVKDTVDSHTQTINSHESTLSGVTAKQAEFTQNLDGFKTEVSNTYSTKDELIDAQNDLSQDISVVEQQANKINWVVGSGTSQSNMTLTDEAYNLISDNITLTADHIDLDGYVSNSSDDPNWSIGTDGNMEVKNMNVEGEMSTDVLNCNVINNPNYPATLSGDINLYVSNLVGSDDYTLDEVLASIDESEAQGSADLIKKFYSLRGVESALPRNLNGKTVRIYLETDDNGQILFRNFMGGRILIFLCSHEVKGYIGDYNCYSDFKIYGGSTQSEPTTYGVIRPSTNTVYSSDNSSVFFQKSPACGIYYCNIYGGSSASGYSAVKVTEDCMCRIELCNFYSAYTFVNVSSISQVFCNKTTGKATDYAFKSYTGSMLHLANTTQASGTKGNVYCSNGSVIYGTLAQTISGTNGITWDSSTAVENTTTTTKTITATVTYKSNYGDTYRSTVYNNWKKDGTCRQGDYGYGDCTGLWFFGTAFAEVKGKTINKVTITIKRQTGGTSASVEHKLWMHNYSTRPSGAPTLTSGWSKTFNLAVGNSTTITITDSTVLNAIKNGTCKGFAIRHTYDSSHYSVCSGSATVKITYTE